MSMEDLEQPLSPSEAARVLSNSRWNRDEAHEARQVPPEADDGPEYFGKEGVERAAGFEPMRPMYDVKQAAEEALDSADIKQQLEEPKETPPPLEINYLEGGDPEKPLPLNQTVDPSQASSDLARWRENIGQQIEAAEDQEVRRIVDELRAADAQGQQAQSDPNAPSAQPVTAAPEAQPPPVAEDPVTKALKDPAVLNAVQTEVQKHYAVAEQARQNYESAMAQNAAAAAYSLIASFPELQGVRPEQIPVAIQVVAKQAPARAEQILRHIDQVGRLVEQHQRAQSAQVQAFQQEAQRQWKSYADDQDARYTEFEKTRPAAEVKQVRENVLRVLSSIYGMPESDLIQAYQTNPTARSAAMQRMAYDVTAAQLAREGVAAKAVPAPIPKVQRPGTSGERASESEYEFRSLNEKINRTSGREQIRAAAELIAARRARR